MCHYNMCEKRTRKIKRGSHITQQREARRLQRLQLLQSPTRSEDSRTPTPVPVSVSHPTVNKAAQTRVMLELAWKTLVLVQKNKIIQQKINSLKKETSEFVASVMKNPESRQRYLENVRLYNLSKQQNATISNVDIKVEPSS